MTQTLHPRTRWRAALLAAATTFALLLTSSALAQEVPCGVGQEVQGDMGGGAKGMIAEIGAAAPHVGWYRIVFDWNKPHGDWYAPSQWQIRPVGGTGRCTPAKAPASPPPRKPGEAAATPTAPPAQPPAPGVDKQLPSTDRCKSGMRVVDRQKRAGMILGETNGSCRVRLDDGSSQNYLHWMLSPADAATPGGGLPAGTYTCSADGAGTFTVGIRDGGTYVDRAGQQGRFQLDAASSRISFESGSLAGQYSKLLGPGKFGLSAAQTTLFYTVCNLRR